jgi:hypothetical protein
VGDRVDSALFALDSSAKSAPGKVKVIEVIDPDDPAAAYLDVNPPQTDWVASGIDVDADHPGEFAPEAPPDAANGARLSQQISARPVSDAAGEFDLRLLSPSDVYAALAASNLPERPAMARERQPSGSKTSWALPTNRSLNDHPVAPD